MAEAEQQFCIECGEANALDARFCTNCGHQVGAPPAANTTNVVYQQAPGFGCSTCGGNGERLSETLPYCPECRWLRPLSNEYFLELDAFMWHMDAQGMNALNNLGPLTAAAHGIAERFGRPVFEAATNGIRLSERQMPEIFDLAVKAGRLMSLSHLPEVYISGERMWDVYSLGGYGGSFISIGSVLVNFKPDDLLFLIAREMGHVRAGHVFWKTAMQFLMGNAGGKATIMGEGVMQFLNPAKLIESAIEAPLMRWSRHAEITADRAATLVTGNVDRARQVLTQWAMKSFPIYSKVNAEAWLEQEAASDDPYLKMSEWTMATTPYLAPRLRILGEYHESEGYAEWRNFISHWEAGVYPEPLAERKKPADDTERLTCAACGEKMRVPKKVLESDKPVNVRCPNEDCRKILRVKPRKKPVNPREEAKKQKARLACVSCKETMFVDRAALEGDKPVNVRCPNKACGEILSIKPKKPEPPDILSD